MIPFWRGSSLLATTPGMTFSSDTSLQGLIDGARSGDATARELLLDHACDRLHRLTRKMLRNYPSLWTEFHEAVTRLASEHREVVDLLFYDGISQHEAADVLGVSIRTLKRRWQQAKLVLHEALRDRRGT